MSPQPLCQDTAGEESYGGHRSSNNQGVTVNSSRERVERNIYKRTMSDGRTVRFELSYRDADGVQRRQTVAKGGIKAARIALRKAGGAVANGESTVDPKDAPLFADMAEAWQTAESAALRPATIAAYGAHVKALTQRWGTRRLSTIDTAEVAKLVRDEQAAGRRAWTIRGRLVVTSLVFDFARDSGLWQADNPVRGLGKRQRPRSDATERRVLTGDELDLLINAASPTFRLIIQIAAMTGARLGEVLGLRWKSIDLGEATITIDRQLDRTGHLAKPKSESSARTIEIPGSLVRQLREAKIAAVNCRPHDLVNTTRTGEPRDHRNVGAAFTHAAKRAGLTDPKPTFHSLRHTFASRYIAAGGDVVSLSSHLGHANAAVTGAVYAHEYERVRRGPERKQRLDAIFGTDQSPQGSDRAATEDNAARQTLLDATPEVTALRANRDQGATRRYSCSALSE